MQLTQSVLLAAAGLVGGAVNAIAGGGSLIVFPAFVATGYGTLAANVTNSVAQWPGYVGVVAGLRDDLAGQRRRVLALSGIAALGSVAGCIVLLATPDSAFDAVVPFLVLGASLLLALQPRIRRLVRPPQDRDNLRLLLPVMFLAGAYGGYFGGALGVILIGMLALTVHDSLRRVNAAKSVLSLIIATVTVVIFAIFGPVNWVGVAVVAPAALVGGYLGARVARRMPDQVLRWCVVVFGITVAVLLYLRAHS